MAGSPATAPGCGAAAPPGGGRLHGHAAGRGRVVPCRRSLPGGRGVGVSGAGGEGRDLAVEGVQGADDLGELVVAAGEADRFLGLRGRREPGGSEAQHGERPGEGAGDRRGHADSDQQASAEQGDAQFEGRDVGVAQPLHALDAAGGEGRLDAAHLLDTGREGGLQLLRVGPLLLLRQLGPVGEGVEELLRGRDLRAGDRRGERVACGGVGLLSELGEGDLLADPGEVRGGAERVAGAGGGGRRRVLAGAVGAGDRVELDAVRGVGAGHGQGGEQQAARGGGALGGLAEFGGGAPGGVGAGRGAVGELRGEPLELADDLGVRAVRLQGGAGAGEGAAAELGDPGEDPAEVLGSGGADLVDLAVDAGGVGGGGRGCGGAAALVLARAGPGAGVARTVLGAGVVGVLVARGAAPGGDVLGDLVPLVREGVGQGDCLSVELGERDQPLRLVQVCGGGEQTGGPGADDGDADECDAGHQSTAYAYAAPARNMGIAGSVTALLHRCSHS